MSDQENVAPFDVVGLYDRIVEITARLNKIEKVLSIVPCAIEADRILFFPGVPVPPLAVQKGCLGELTFGVQKDPKQPAHLTPDPAAPPKKPVAIHVADPDRTTQCGKSGASLLIVDTLEDARTMSRLSNGAAGICYHCWNMVDPDGIPTRCGKCGVRTTVGALRFGGVCDDCYTECGGDDGDC